MANVDNPSGFTPIRHLSGAPFNGQANLYNIPSSNNVATFLGDLVIGAGSATAGGIPTAVQAAAADTSILGAVIGFEVDPDDLTLMYRLASTSRNCFVTDDPYTVYEVQEDSDGGALTADEVGENCEIIVGSGNTTSGISAMEIDSDSHTANAAQIRVMRLVQRENNAIGNNAKWEVFINEHLYKRTAGV